jgi:hypothetical protein
MLTNVARLCTAIVLVIVVIIGGIVVILDPQTLDFKDYVATVAVAAGLLGIGYGLDSESKP